MRFSPENLSNIKIFFKMCSAISAVDGCFPVSRFTGLFVLLCLLTCLK